MAIYLDELIRRIPSDTEQVVAATRKRFNAKIRQLLIRETGLRLSTGQGTEDEARDVQSVRVHLEAGLPAELERKEFDESKRLAILLTPWRTSLERLRDSSETVRTNLLPQLGEWPSLPEQYPDMPVHLERTHEFSEVLLREALAFDLIKELHAIDDDILGRYWLSGNLFSDEAEGRISIFWAVIGLVGQALGISTEALTIKVLAHELAHAYTHLGADINGHRWSSDAFFSCDRSIREGLAQYYALRVIERVKAQVRDAEDAFNELLKHQPEPYHAHKRWLESGATPETVRLALMLFRRGRAKDLAAFEAFLDEANQRLGRAKA